MTVLLGKFFSAESQSRHEEMARSRELDLPLFDFAAIAAATDHFSTDNLLGKGGFGPVYMVNQLASSTDQSLVVLEVSFFLIFEL